MMEIRFPVDLQKRFERALLEGEFAPGLALDLATLATRLNASPEKMHEVLLAEYRKGLVAPQVDGRFRILALARPSIDSVFQHTAKQGLVPTADVRAVEIEPASAVVAAKLALPRGAPVYRQERTRKVNGEVIANQRNYIPFQVCPGLEKEDISHSSFQELLEGKYHAIIAEKREQYALVPANAEDLAILSLPAGVRVLVVERLSLSVNAQPLVWAGIHIRTDRYVPVAKLFPEAAELIEER